MLLVPTRLDVSPIHRYGVFADAPVPEGTPVWQFTGGFDLDLDPALVDALPETFRRPLLHYGYVDARLGRYILCCDDYRFINHSATPNLRADTNMDPRGVDIAVRDIAEGEELTIDYGLVESRRSGYWEPPL